MGAQMGGMPKWGAVDLCIIHLLHFPKSRSFTTFPSTLLRWEIADCSLVRRFPVQPPPKTLKIVKMYPQRFNEPPGTLPGEVAVLEPEGGIRMGIL